MPAKPYTPGRTFIGRLERGADLVATITRIANAEGVKVGTVSVHGLIDGCALSRIDPASGLQETIRMEGRFEIGHTSGTISQFKGRSMVRLNGVLAAEEGTLVAGTLAPGCLVHACEVVITEYTGGGVLSRDFDPETGLPLWKGILS